MNKNLFKLIFITTLFFYLFIGGVESASKDISKLFFSQYPFKSAKWTVKVVVKDKNNKEQGGYVQKYWYKNKKLRTEQIYHNNAGKLIMIYTTKYLYLMNEKEKSVMRYSLTNNNSQYLNIVAIATQRNRAKLVGEGRFKSKKYDIYKYTTKYEMSMPGLTGVNKTQIVSHIKEWRDKKTGFIMKQIVTTEPYKIKIGFITKTVKPMITTSTVESLEENIKIPNSLFKISKKYDIVDMDSYISSQQNQQENSNEKQLTEEERKELEAKEKEEAKEERKELIKDAVKGLLGF